MAKNKYSKFVKDLEEQDINNVVESSADENINSEESDIESNANDNVVNVNESLKNVDDNAVVDIDDKSSDNDDDLKKYDWNGLGKCQYLYDHPEVLEPDELENEKPSKRENKNDILYDKLGSPQGITLDELQNNLGWEQKSIRGNMTNMQKKKQFTLVTINVSSPDLDNGGFKKETYYLRKDVEFDIKNDFFKKLVDEQS